MDNLNKVRIAVSRNHQYPAEWTQPIITRLFRQKNNNGVIGIQYKNNTDYVGSGEYKATIAPPSFIRLMLMLLNPAYRIPNYYTRGFWSCEEGRLSHFLETMSSPDNSSFYKYYKKLSINPVRDFIAYKLFPLKVKKNIALHYNTSPTFMKLILGDTLEYTCAFYDNSSDSLNDAQKNKIRKIIERIGIKKEDNTLDLGCGWGQIAETVSRITGSKVTGVNISSGQVKYAKEASSGDTTFIRSDYESYTPNTRFDKVYSIGMLEHIGRGKLNSYFKYIDSVLSKDGLALVHCIINKDSGSTNSWIDDVVFPGAHIPQLSSVVRAVEESGLDIKKIHFHDSSNYYNTLSDWERNYRINFKELRRLVSKEVGSVDGDQVMRIWEFYLCCSKMLFSKQGGSCYNAQVILSHPKSKELGYSCR